MRRPASITTARRRAGFGGGAVLAVIAALHGYWALGGRRGRDSVVPTSGRDGAPAFAPTTSQTVGVAGALAVAAVCYAGAAAGIGPTHLTRLGAGGAATVVGLRAIGDRRSIGFTKRRRDTRFDTLDTFAFSPLCTLLSVAGLLVATAPSTAR